MSSSNNSSLVESADSIDARYAEALLPLRFVFGFLAFSGILGNTVVLIVFSTSREYNKSNFKVYALFHGVIDLVMCMTVIPAEIIMHIHYFAFVNATACKVKCFLNYSASGASSLTLMLISVDRFRHVNKPLGTQMSQQLAARLCLIFIFVALLLASPAVLLCGIEEVSIPNIHGGNTTVYLCLADEKFKSSVWRLVYKRSLLCLQGIVSVTCIVMYVFVFRTVYQATRKRMGQESFRMLGRRAEKHLDSRKEKFIEVKNALEDSEGALVEEKPNTRESCTVSRAHTVTLQKQSSQSTDSDRIGQFPYKTVIWFVLTVTFVATHIVRCTLMLYPHVINALPPDLFTLQSFFHRLNFLNSVINPLVYALLDPRFRRTCRRIFRERICF